MAKGVRINFDLMKPKVSKIMADTANDVADLQVDGIRGGHIAGIDVNDRPFTPKKDGSPSRLFKSGTMMDGWHVSKRATPAKPKATITSGKRSQAYAARHNEGDNIAKRQVAPENKVIGRTQKDVDARLKIASKRLVDVGK